MHIDSTEIAWTLLKKRAAWAKAHLPAKLSRNFVLRAIFEFFVLPINLQLKELLK